MTATRLRLEDFADEGDDCREHVRRYGIRPRHLEKLPPYGAIARRIVDCRRILGFSSAALAKSAGLPRSTVLRIERGERTPTIAVAALLLDAFRREGIELRAEWFFLGRGLSLRRRDDAGATSHAAARRLNWGEWEP